MSGKLRDTSTSTLRAMRKLLRKRPLCWVFEGQLSDIELELLARRMPLIAERCGGFLVEWVLGVQ